MVFINYSSVCVTLDVAAPFSPPKYCCVENFFSSNSLFPQLLALSNID